jgi:hypothetical protein
VSKKIPPGERVSRASTLIRREYRKQVKEQVGGAEEVRKALRAEFRGMKVPSISKISAIFKKFKVKSLVDQLKILGTIPSRVKMPYYCVDLGVPPPARCREEE